MRKVTKKYVKGDLVVYEITGCVGEFIEHVELHSSHHYCRVDFGLGDDDSNDDGLILLKHIRHANDAEIATRKS